jgi:tetratricopeptide (TPR) repeat protein
MKTRHLRIAAPLLALFVLASCGGDPNIESAKLNLSRKDYKRALESVDAAIATNPANPLAYYYKGQILIEIGKQETVPNRTPFYQRADSALTASSRLYEETAQIDKEYLLIDLMRSNAWVEEYNGAINTINAAQASEMTDTQFERIVGHLNNAFAILPDSLNAVDLLAEVYLFRNDYEMTIATYQRAMALATDTVETRYMRLGELYVQQQRYEEALDILKTGLAIFPGQLEMTQALANAYLQMNNTDRALEVLGDLIDMDPENKQYRLVYGFQLYELTRGLSDDLRNVYTQLDDVNRMIREEERKSRPNRTVVAEHRATQTRLNGEASRIEGELSDLSSRAIAELRKASELDATDSNPFFIWGVVLQDSASRLIDKRNATDDNAKAMAFDNQAKALLQECAGLYETAAGIEPDNTEYWMALFRVYTALGQTAKALEAQEKAGL